MCPKVDLGQKQNYFLSAPFYYNINVPYVSFYVCDIHLFIFLMFVLYLSVGLKLYTDLNPG